MVAKDGVAKGDTVRVVALDLDETMNRQICHEMVDRMGREGVVVSLSPTRYGTFNLGVQFISDKQEYPFKSGELVVVERQE